MFAALAAAVMAAIGVYEFNNARQRNVAAAQAWKVEGPPCPEVTRAEFEAQGYRTKKTSTYAGVAFGRQTGHVQCKELADKGGAGMGKQLTCQFTSPAVVSVTVEGVESAYLVGPGPAVTIVVEDDQVRCVTGGDKSMSLR